MRHSKIVNRNFKLCFMRFFSNKSVNNLKSFKDIPTLPQVPVLGHSYLFFPGGKYTSAKITEAIDDISRKLGPLFRLKFGKTDILISTDADNTEILSRHEGKCPLRPSFDALSHYRKKVYGGVGVVPANGEDWYKYRKGVTSLLKASVVQSYKSQHEEIARNFVDYIKRNRTKQMVLEDVYYHMMKYTIQVTSVISPGYTFNSLHDNAREETDDIISANIDFMDGMFLTLMGFPTWKLYKNKGYSKIETSHRTMHQFLEKYLRDLNNLNSTQSELVKEKHPYLHNLLNNSSYSWNEKLLLAMEIFLGGIDATATTLSTTLHFLAHNTKAQDLAREDSVSVDSRSSYLIACIKEALRMCPTAGSFARITVTDVNIGGYLIPKNTLVSCFTSVTTNREEYFDQPKSYRPERWLRGCRSNVHHFASLPFGFGARMCPGRRLAEQEMVLLLKEILKSYKLAPVDGEKESLGMVFRLNRILERKMNIKFINTNS